MMFGRIISVLAVALAVLAAGCSVGRDYQRPDLAEVTPEKYQYAPAGDEAGRVGPDDRWWEAFGDPELTGVVERVLAHNLDLAEAAERVLELQSQFVVRRADRWPSVSLRGEAQKQWGYSQKVEAGEIEYIPGEGLSVGKSRIYWEANEVDSFSLSLPVSFELDLWGRLARLEESARAELLAQEETRVTVAQTVVSEAVSTYLQIESLERRLQTAEENTAAARSSLDLVEGRYERGLSNVLALRQARRNVAQAEASVPALRQDLGLAQQRLSLLMGEYPRTTPSRAQPVEYFQSLDPVPPGLPSELLLRRPDVRAAEAGLKALNAAVGAAEAARFPSISLTGALGLRSDELGHMFDAESRFWSMAAGVTQPLFNAGKLKANQRAAESRYRQAVVRYAKAVLEAFAEVEGALLRRQELFQRRERVVTLLDESRATQEVAESRYQRGLSTYLDVLEAQQTRYQAEDSLIQVDLAILSNRVTLHRALGGGWAGVELASPKENEDNDESTDESSGS